MKALGKIGTIDVSYQMEKTSNTDGHKYWGERYTIFFESGDDIHMVDSGWLHCQSQNGGIEVLKRRGITIGAEGKMTMRYGFRDYNGRRFPECELVRFESMAQSPATPSTANNNQPEASAQEVTAGFAEAAIEAEANGDEPAF